MQGSDDGKHWENIIKHDKDANLRKPGDSYTWKIKNCKTFYSQFKILSNDQHPLLLSGIELYGDDIIIQITYILDIHN